MAVNTHARAHTRTHTLRTHLHHMQVYSFLFTGFGTAALLGPILSSMLLSKGGFGLAYTVLGLLSLLSFLLCNFI